MMTARKSLTNEVAKVFDFIGKPFKPVRFRELLVSPNEMKPKLIRLINDEMKHAKEGKEAWIRMKINHITDEDMVAKLYEASRAGVRIELVLRGNCSLIPGVAGWSDHIRAVGIIDHYLEHSRIFIFANGGEPLYYIGSADWMPRNLVNRIEVLTPVYDPEMQQDLWRTVDYGLRDTLNGRIIDGKGSNELQAGTPFRSQAELYKVYSQVQTTSNNTEE